MPFPLIAIVVAVVRIAAPIVIKVAIQAVKQAPKVGKVAVKQGPKQATKKTVTNTTKKVGNTSLNKYRDKAMEKLSKACQKAVKKFGGHIHGKKNEVVKPNQESNHMLQNAMLEDERGKGSTICSQYRTSRGPAVPLGEKSHKKVTGMQRKFSQKHRDAGTQPTYQEARAEAKKQTQKGTGATKSEAECLMKFMDQVFEQLCPELTQPGSTLRTPKR